MRIFSLLLALFCLLAVSVQGQTTTFCEKYAAALFGNGTRLDYQTTLISAVVTRAVLGATVNVSDSFGVPLNNVVGLFKSPLQVPIFNGSVAYKTNPPNYVTNQAALGSLAGKLVAFFGNAFGCRAAGYPVYVAPNNSTQKALHQNMGINKAIMNDFITILANTLTSFGVTSADVTGTAAPFLRSFNRCAGNNEICNNADCDQAPGSTCSSGGYASATAYSSWAVVAISWVAFFLARKNL